MMDELGRLRLLVSVARGAAQVQGDPAAVAGMLAEALAAELADGAIVVLERPDLVRRFVHRDAGARAAMDELLADVRAAGLPVRGRAEIVGAGARGCPEWNELARRCAPASVLVAPLGSPRGPFGAIVLVRSRRAVRFAEEELHAVLACVEHVTLALEHAIALRDRGGAERREAERRDRAAEPQLLDQLRRDNEHMLGAIRDGVVLLGADWRYRFVNRRAAVLLGRPADELVGRIVWDHLPEVAQTQLGGVMREVMAGAHADPILVEERGAGSNRWNESTVSRCGNGILVVWRDVTERKQAELTLRRALGLRDEFISVISHELRTPLAGLALHLDSLERIVSRGAEPEQLPARIQGALRQSERLEVLVEELLDAFRLASGGLELTRAAFDLRDLVLDVAERMRDAAARSGCELNLQLGGAAVGAWDRARLGRALGNLVGNAIKYGARAPIDIELAANEGAVEITVRDRGIGVTEEDRSRIFGRFERAVPHSHYGGLGLGLYIARQIVEAHGGTIDVESVPREGATFVVRLPRLSVTLGRATGSSTA
jgi:PAS domain S-box-containing protein